MRRPGFFSALLLLGLISPLSGLPLPGHSKWTELNIGPFYVDTAGDAAAAREQLTQLEQLRWVLGGLLDSNDLPSPWPIRVILANTEQTDPPAFVSENGPLFGQLVFIRKPGSPAPVAQVARILLDGNTPRLPADAESGLLQLLSSLNAHGSHVTWGGPVPHPDLAWARMQLFATKFEYSASFHVFVTSLRNGSSIRVAERNAFNGDPDQLEKEAAANLASGHWQSVPVSGRPLDPKRDLGEHSIQDAAVETYLAAPSLNESAFKNAIEAGGPAKALGYEGLAFLARRDGQDPKPLLQNAVNAGSHSAPVFQALGDFKTAASIAPRWSAPVAAQAEAAANPTQKESLVKKALAINPRNTALWIQLAELQDANGHPEFANGSWLRAADSAPSPSERDRIEQMRQKREQERLDAEAGRRQSERDQARLDDQKAQDDEMARIHAAERKANSLNGNDTPNSAVSWDELNQKNLSGLLVRVDCLGTSDRLAIKDRTGHTTELTLADASKLPATCGAQKSPRHISVTFSDNRVLSLELK